MRTRSNSVWCPQNTPFHDQLILGNFIRVVNVCLYVYNLLLIVEHFIIIFQVFPDSFCHFSSLIAFTIVLTYTLFSKCVH